MALWSNGRWLNWNLCVRAIVYLIFHSRIEKWNKEICWRLWCFCEFEKYRHFSDKYDNRLMLFLPGYVFFFFRLTYFVRFLNLLFLFLGRGEGEREGEKYLCLVASHVPPPHQGPAPQPRHVSWLGIELMTLWFAGWHPIHRATPARARLIFLYLEVAEEKWHL